MHAFKKARMRHYQTVPKTLLQRERMKTLACAALLLLTTAGSTQASAYPRPTPGDFLIRNFRFASGETLPELRIHYRTFGTPRRDAEGVVRNAVLILHGTGGDGGSLINDMFAGEL